MCNGKYLQMTVRAACLGNDQCHKLLFSISSFPFILLQNNRSFFNLIYTLITIDLPCPLTQDSLTESLSKEVPISFSNPLLVVVPSSFVCIESQCRDLNRGLPSRRAHAQAQYSCQFYFLVDNPFSNWVCVIDVLNHTNKIYLIFDV